MELAGAPENSPTDSEQRTFNSLYVGETNLWNCEVTPSHFCPGN